MHVHVCAENVYACACICVDKIIYKMCAAEVSNINVCMCISVCTHTCIVMYVCNIFMYGVDMYALT